MRVREFLTETNSILTPGWQQESIFEYSDPLGKIIIIDRLDDDLTVVETMYLYFNKFIQATEPVYGLRWKNNSLYAWDYLHKLENKLISQQVNRQQILSVFLTRVSDYWHHIMRNNIMEFQFDKERKITPDEILNMSPGLKERMEWSIMNHGKKPENPPPIIGTNGTLKVNVDIK
jgi:hypothetical protein